MCSSDLEQVFTATKFVVSQLKSFKEVQTRLAKVAPRIRGMVSQGSISDEAQAQKLLNSLGADLPTEPKAEDVLKSIRACVVTKGKEGKMVQLAAGKRVTKGGLFVTPEGSTILFSHVGKIEGKLSTYAQKVDKEGASGSMGMHFTKVDKDVTTLEKTGEQNLVWSSLKEDEVLKLEDVIDLEDIAVDTAV